MTSYLQNSTGHEASVHSRFAGSLPQAGLTAEEFGEWRLAINRCDHPVMVLDAGFRPTLLNEPLRQKLSDPSNSQGLEQPTAFVWQTICDTASRIVSEAAKSSSNEFAEAFPIQRRCFTAVGCLLRNAAGHVTGAIVNLGDLTGSQHRLRSASGSDEPSSQDPSGVASRQDADFLQWNAYREQARQKMAKLSRRESQVVSLVSDGLPNKRIAHALDISVKTIEKHRANATRKLGVGSTAEMVRIAVVAEGKSPEVEEAVTEVTTSEYQAVR